MSNCANCLLIVGGSADALDRFERATPGPFPDGALPEVYYQPEIVRERRDADDYWWPKMTAVPVGQPLRAYLTTKKYGPPGSWLSMAGARHPELRFALLWIDTDFNNCGHGWVEGDDSPLWISLGGKDFERFADHRAGWLGCITDAVAWVVRSCPGSGRVRYAIVDELLEAFLPTARSVLTSPQQSSSMPSNGASIDALEGMPGD